MDIQEQIADLQRQLDALKSATSIPYEIDQAFRNRFNLSSFASLAASSKAAGAENVGIDEAGVATHTVLGAPDGFRQFSVGGSTLHFPYFL